MSKLNTELAQGLTVCLLGASYDTGNRGVAALASGTVNSVRHYFPGATVFLLDYGRKPKVHAVRCSDGIAEVELVNLRFSWKIWLRNNIARLLITALLIRLLPSRSLRRRLIARNLYLKRIQESDIVASIAGGDSFSDIYGMVRLLYVSLPQLLVLLLEAPLIVLPQTLGPFKSYPAKGIARYIIANASVVYARDMQSLRATKRLLGTKARSLEFSYDMAFALEPFPPAEQHLRWIRETQTERPLVGFNLSGLLYLGGYTRDNMFGLNVDYRKLICDTLSFFIEDMDCRVMLVPHAFKAGDTSESDTIACKEVLKEFGGRYDNRIQAVDGNFDEHEIKYLIGQCEFFLGSRMHACIAALSQCVPAVGLAYSRKFDGVLRSIRMEELVVDLCDKSSASVIERISVLYESRDRIRQELEGTIPDVRNSVLNLFSRPMKVSTIKRTTGKSMGRPMPLG